MSQTEELSGFTIKVGQEKKWCLPSKLTKAFFGGLPEPSVIHSPGDELFRIRGSAEFPIETIDVEMSSGSVRVRPKAGWHCIMLECIPDGPDPFPKIILSINGNELLDVEYVPENFAT